MVNPKSAPNFHDADIYSEIEEALVNRLAQLSDFGLFITNSPKKSRVPANAQVLVYLSGTTDERPGSNMFLANSLLSYTIEVMTTDQRAHQSAYPFLHNIRALIQGFRPNVQAKTGAFYISSIDYVPFQEGEKLSWTYSLIFNLSVLY